MSQFSNDKTLVGILTVFIVGIIVGFILKPNPPNTGGDVDPPPECVNIPQNQNTVEEHFDVEELDIEKILNYREDINLINSVTISPQDPIIVSGSNGKIVVWNVDGHNNQHNPIKYPISNNGKYIAISLDGKRIAIAGKKVDGGNKIFISELPNLQQSQTIPETENVTSLALSCTADTLAIGSSNGIKIWNVKTRKQKYEPLPGHNDKVTFLAISPDGQTLASGSQNGEIKIWNLGTGKLKYDLQNHASGVKSLAISPNGQKLVSSSHDGKIKIWNLMTGNLRYSLTGSEEQVTSVAISPDGKTFASGSTDGKIKVWNLENGQLQRIYNLLGHNNEFITLAMHSNKQILVSGHILHDIKMWLVP